jgi:hypothetical protein
VLIRRHGSGVDIEIRVNLLDRYRDSTALEYPAYGSDTYAFAYRADHAAGYKDIFAHKRNECRVIAIYISIARRRKNSKEQETQVERGSSF